MPVTRRFVGVVGGCRSRAAEAGEAGKSNTSTRATAANTEDLEKNRVFILIYSFSNAGYICHRTAVDTTIVYRTIRQKRSFGCIPKRPGLPSLGSEPD